MNASPRRKVLVVEDDVGTRQALTVAIRQHEYDVIAVGSGEEALELPLERLDAAVVDLGLPGISGTETIRGLRQIRPHLPVLVLTVFEDPERVVAAIEAGASGYQLKGATLPELRRALEQVIGGLSPLSPAIASHLLDAIRRRGAHAVPERRAALTPREVDVLALLVHGHSYVSIAGALDIGLGTVQTHVKSVYRKLEVASKAEAAAVAVTHNLLPRGT